MRIVVLGAHGQVGTDFVKAAVDAGHQCIALGRAQLDVTDGNALRQCLPHHRPEAIVNCTVFHPLEQCEQDPATSMAVNALALRDLGIASAESGASVLHFSSDFVFGGELRRPYTEEDLPAPRSVFGACKLAGEHLLAAACERHFILRTSGLYGHAGSRVKKGNFIETMLRLGRQNGRVRVIADVRTSPTATIHLARQAVALLQTSSYGTYHAADHGDVSWCEFARMIFRLARLDVEVEPSQARDVPGMSLRPAYSVLENRKLKALGLDVMQPVEPALEQYLTTREAVSGTVAG